ncbi:hypothetical protein HUK80_00085 [Flavobacterium sp. MAH-1]|uniref:Uncharacterized protein n=1 Tax=Flavobacterium agri TaxID=2743471 RepID=A0A7Y8XZQ7_9FLAO|nr:hypothetical protein [Flavobacterium agri]NUY79274.1 hypothetical protein [Flavobacterium agri]NYA69298.1 hypothetical protein [Flavobacterium agri]
MKSFATKNRNRFNDMKSTITLCLLLLCSSVFGQSRTVEALDSFVLDFTKKLKRDKISNIIIYKSYSSESTTQVNTADYDCSDEFWSNPSYVMWQDRKMTYLTRFDMCHRYTQITIDDHGFWQDFQKHEKQLKAEELKDFEFISEEKDTLSYVSAHGTFKEFTYLGRKQQIKKTVGLMVLSETTAQGEKNINYDYNSNSRTMVVIRKLDAIIAENERLLKVAKSITTHPTK